MKKIRREIQNPQMFETVPETLTPAIYFKNRPFYLRPPFWNPNLDPQYELNSNHATLHATPQSRNLTTQQSRNLATQQSRNLVIIPSV
jgi:hypothetical protein